MGYMAGVGECVRCRQIFSFNIDRVPSVRGVFNERGEFIPDESGNREPVCRGCFNLLNDARVAVGLAPIPLLPGAYGPEEVA